MPVPVQVVEPSPPVFTWTVLLSQAALGGVSSVRVTVPEQVLEFPDWSVIVQLEVPEPFTPLRLTLVQLTSREASQLSVADAEALPEPEQTVDPAPPVVSVVAVQTADAGGLVSVSTSE